MNTSEQNYKLIRKTAMKLFREQGFDNVTVKDICEAAGVPRRSYYSLFQNKDELILSYFKMDQNLLADVDTFTSLLMQKDAYSKLIGLVRTYLELSEQNGRHFMSQLFRIGTQSEESALLDIAVSMKDMSTQLIKECQEDGSILNQTAPDLLWESLTTFMIGISYIWCSGEEFPLIETAMSRFEDLVVTKPELRQYHNEDLYLKKD